MGLLSIFQNLFKKQKALPTPKSNQEIIKPNEKEKFSDRIKENVEETKPNTIDFAIEQYLKSFYYFYQNGYGVNSYKALTNLSACPNQNGNGNEKREEELVKSIRENGNYQLLEQKNNDGNVASILSYKK